MPYRFDQEFLKLVIKYIIESGKIKYISIFKPDYFCDEENLSLREIFKYVKKRFYKDDKIPSYEKILRNAGGSFNPDLVIEGEGIWGNFRDNEEKIPEIKKKIIENINEIQNMKGIGPDEEEEFEEKIKDFIQWINSRMFAMQLIDDIGKGEVHPEDYQSFVNKIKSVDSKEEFNPINYFEDYNKEEYYENIPSIKTGIPTLDKWMDGGLQLGKIGVVVGETGIGKSFLLVNLAKAAYLEGNNVFYISFELGKVKLKKRFDRCFSGLYQSEISENRDIFKKTIEEKKISNTGLIMDRLSGHLTSVGDIKSRIQDLKNKFDLKLLIIDYLELLKLDSREEQKYEALGHAVEDLRELAQEENIAIWCAQQSIRKAYGKTPKMEDTQSSIMIVQVVDVFIGLSDDPKNKGNILKINVEKLRRAENRKGKFIYLKPNFALSRIEEMPEFEEVKKGKKKKIKIGGK